MRAELERIKLETDTTQSVETHSDNILNLYSNKADYADKSTMIITRYDGDREYVLEGDVWHRKQDIPVIDTQAKRRVGLESALVVAEQNVSQTIQSDLHVFQEWQRLFGNVQVYQPTPGSSGSRMDFIPFASQDDVYVSADNPLYYKALDPYSSISKLSNTFALRDEEVLFIKGIQEATHIQLTAEGETWMAENIEFYNSQVSFDTQLKRETEKLDATLRALEQSSEWMAASPSKQQELRQRIQKVGNERNAKRVHAFKTRNAVIASALFALLLASDSEYIDGTPELSALCGTNLGNNLTILQQALEYVVCAVQKTRIITEEKAEVMDLCQLVLQDKTDLAKKITSVVSIPWRIAVKAPYKAAKVKANAQPPTQPVQLLVLQPLLRDTLQERIVSSVSENDTVPSLQILTRRLDFPSQILKHEHKVLNPPIIQQLTQVEPGFSDRIARRLGELDIPGAAVYSTIQNNSPTAVLESFVRTYMMTFLSRAAHGYRAATTAAEKKYLGRNQQHSVEEAHVAQCRVMSEVDGLDRTRFQEVMAACLGNTNTKEDVKNLMSAILSAVLNFPQAGRPYSVTEMVSPSPVARRANIAIATYFMMELVGFVKSELADLESLTKSKDAARKVRDSKLLAQMESMDPELQNTIQTFRKMNFKDWKGLIPEDIEAEEEVEEKEPAKAVAQERENEEGMEEVENDDEVEDDAVTDGFVRDDN